MCSLCKFPAQQIEINFGNIELLGFCQPWRNGFQSQILTNDTVDLHHQISVVSMLALQLQFFVDGNDGITVLHLILGQILPLQILHHSDKFRGISLEFLLIFHIATDHIRSGLDQRLLCKILCRNQGRKIKPQFIKECVGLSDQFHNTGNQLFFIYGRISAILAADIGGIVCQCLSQCLYNANIVHNQAITLAFCHTIGTGNGLHQGMCLQRLVQIQA